MTNIERDLIIENSWTAHKTVEESYLNNHSVKGGDGWSEKQRLLLADMALHLLQTALEPAELKSEKLKNNIYSILAISDQFLPDSKLSDAKDNLFI